MGTPGGLNRHNGSQKGFTRYLYDAAPQNRAINIKNPTHSILEDTAGVLWVGTGEGLYRFDKNHNQLKFYEQNINDPDSLPGPVTTILEDRYGWLWVGTLEHGLNRFDRKTERFVRYMHHPDDPGSLSNEVIWALMEDRSGNLWAGTEGGVNILNRETGRFTRLVSDSENPHSIGSNYITSLLADQTGAIWVGSGSLWGRGRGGGFGIDKWDAGQAQFRRMANDPVNIPGIKDAKVQCVFEDREGIIWMGSWYAGLIRVDRRTGEQRRFIHDPENPRSIGQNSIMSLFEDHEGVFWVGTADRGLNRFDRRHESFTRYMHDPDDPHSLSYNRISEIYEDHSGTLWLPTFGGGLDRFDRHTGQFTHYMYDPGNPYSIGGNQLARMVEDSTGILWIATWGSGLDRFDPKLEQFTHFNHDPHNPNSISDNITWDVHLDRHGAIWIATNGGLNRFDPATGNFTCFTEKNGLASNLLTSIQEDNKGRLWLGTVNGLTRFDPENGATKIFTVSDGLNSNAFSFGGPCKTKTGEFIISGGGINIFHPDSIRDNPHIPPVLFTRFTRYRGGKDGGQMMVDNQISEKQQIELTPEDRTLTFEFTALNYRNPVKNQFAYLLEGAQSDWIFIGNQRKITFTNLSPGNYTLRVKGSNNDGVWNEAGASLEIKMLPPWWGTWWAYSLYALLALLTLILGPLEQLIAKNTHAEEHSTFLRMRRNAQRLQRLINQLLDLSKLETGKMELQTAPEDIVQLTKFTVMAFESLAGLRKIDLRLDLPDAPLTVYLDRDKYEKIIANLLSNALKFTPEGGEVEIRISDTGSGIAAAQLTHIFDRFYQADSSHTRKHEGTGIGLALTKELVELHHGEIRVESEVGVGTTFTVRLPLGRAHLRADQIEEREALRQAQDKLRGEERELWRVERDAMGEVEPKYLNVQTPEHPNTGTLEHQILIVEDNPDMRQYMRGHLDSNYRIMEAENGRLGLKAAQQHSPDLIISDVMMPEMDGFALCAKLKTDARTSHIPVILLTARASGESKIEGLETGADDYLTKPFDARELQVRVKNLIAQRRRLQERFRRELIVQPSEVTVTSMDEIFLKKAIAAVEAHIDDPVFDTDNLAREAGISRGHLNRKLRALTGQSAREFIRSIRLKRAAQLLQQQAGNVTEIAYEVGFQSIAHFAKVFRKQFGVAPSEFGEKIKEKVESKKGGQFIGHRDVYSHLQAF